MAFRHNLPPEVASYLSCPRCGLIVLVGGDENGSPLCTDCRGDEVVVTMDLVAVPNTPRI